MTRGAAEIAAPPDRTPPLGRLERRRFQVLVLCAVAVAVLLFLHYTAALHRLGVHDALRRLFYLPVIVAAIAAGSRGGLSIAGFAVLGFLPHLRQLARTDDRVLDSVFELVLLLVVGALVGAYADASRRARAQAAESGRLAALGETGLALMAQTEGPLAAIEGQAESLTAIMDPVRNSAVTFAARVIREEAARARQLLSDLGEIARVSEHHADRIDLAPLVVGVVKDVAHARRDGRRVVLIPSARASRIEADRRALAFSLRTLLFGLLDTIPPPGWLEVRLAERSPGEAVIELGIFSTGEALPDMEESLTRVFGARVGEYRFRQVLCVRLLGSLGATVRFDSISPRHARILVGFREVPAKAANGHPVSHPEPSRVRQGAGG
jgi:signal transduction histidine kinase